MPMVSMTMIWNIPWVNLAVVCSATQSEIPSSKPPNYQKYEIKPKLHGNVLKNVSKAAGNHMKYYGDKERKDNKIDKAAVL